MARCEFLSLISKAFRHYLWLGGSPHQRVVSAALLSVAVLQRGQDLTTTLSIATSRVLVMTVLLGVPAQGCRAERAKREHSGRNVVAPATVQCNLDEPARRV